MTEKNGKKDANSRKKMLDEMFISAHHYLNRAIPEVNVLADGFYQSRTEEVWDTLLQMLEGIQWLMEFMSCVKISQDLYSNGHKIGEITASLEEQLNGLKEAIHVKDMTLIGDILNYEFIPILESVNEQIQNTIDKEVVRDDLN